MRQSTPFPLDSTAAPDTPATTSRLLPPPPSIFFLVRHHISSPRTTLTFGISQHRPCLQHGDHAAGKPFASTTLSLYDASVLRSSFMPDMARSIEIKQSIASQQQFVHSIGARLLDMEREMELLRSQHEAVSKMMEVQEGLLAPMRRLMPEILQRIFEYTTRNFRFYPYARRGFG